MNENEILNELEKLRFSLNDERDALLQGLDMRFNVMENMILKLHKRIASE